MVSFTCYSAFSVSIKLIIWSTVLIRFRFNFGWDEGQESPRGGLVLVHREAQCFVFSLVYCHCLRSIFLLGDFLILSFIHKLESFCKEKPFLISCVLILRYCLYRKGRLNFSFIYYVFGVMSRFLNILQRWPVNFLASWIHKFKHSNVLVHCSYLYWCSYCLMFGQLGAF